jgi:tetratricopeptide (TPR) repeat protein
MGDLPGYFPWIASSLGYGYGLAGRVAEAIPLLEQAVQQSASTGRVGQALWIAYLGEVYGLAGRMDEAIDLARQAIEYACEHKERGRQAHTLRLLGAIAAQREPPESALAEAHYRRALALTEELGMRPLQAHCHLGLGTLYLKRGWREEAKAELFAAIELYRAMEMTFWLPQAEGALAQVEER